MARPLDPSKVSGLHWAPSGQAAFSGSLLEGLEGLDEVFQSWGRRLGAEQYRFPPLVSARELDRIDYLRSFPHLAAFAASLDPDPENIAAFGRQAEAIDAEGAVSLARLSPVHDVLCPAACYPIYIHLAGRTLEGARRITVRSTCFRREEGYSPLRRQATFQMRELVCLGSEEEVARFVEEAAGVVDRFVEHLGVPAAWQQATDPFFNPMRSARYVAQRIAPLKRELVYGGDLALASVNLHQASFGSAFSIHREAGGAPVHSACVAFGLERWLYTFLTHFGTSPAAWPKIQEITGSSPGR